MTSEDHASRFDDEIAEIENRGRKRNLFMILGGIVVVVLAVIVIVGGRERMRLAAEAARPKTEPVDLGQLVGKVANTAVYAKGGGLSYVEGVGDAQVGPDTRYVRRISYDQLGNPDTIPAGITHWSLVQSDSLPYTLEWVTNPLIGVNPSDYQALELGSLRAGDYGTGGPKDWKSLEENRTNVQITGEATREDSGVYLTADSVRARLQGIEGLSAVDSLELDWATKNHADLTAYGRIGSTPRRPTDDTLFTFTLTSVEPPAPEAGGQAGPAPAAAPADTSTPPDTAANP